MQSLLSDAEDAPTVPSVPAVPAQWSYAQLTPQQVRWFWLKTPFSLKGVLLKARLHVEAISLLMLCACSCLRARPAPQGPAHALLSGGPQRARDSVQARSRLHVHQVSGCNDTQLRCVAHLLLACRQKQDTYEAAWWDEQAQFAASPGGKDGTTNPESQASSLSWQVAHPAGSKQQCTLISNKQAS